jgi:acyl-coenzyme A synthetase/AMP-(fatty) acid ligase
VTSDPLVAAFASGVKRHPERPVVVAAWRPPLSASALAALAAAVHDRLAPAIPPGALVGVATSGGASFLASVLALRRAGASVLLLEPGGPALAHRGTAAALGARAVVECESAWPEGSEAFRLEPITPAPDALLMPRETAFVKTTSGSTGRPRGIAVSSEALLADEAALAASMGIGSRDRIVAAVPLSHSFGFTSVALHALVRGATLLMPEGGPLGPVLAAEKGEATVFPTVPAYLGALLKMSQPPHWPESVRLVVAAGAPLLPEIALRFREYSGRGVHAFYGASECGGICFDREGRAAERGTVGTPVEGVQVSLEALADDAEERLAVVASRAVAAAYLPEPDAGRLGSGRFRTSDIACWQGGELKLLRRMDALINVKGKKVDPAEIESALAALSGVEEVVALGVTNPATGGHTLRVVIACRPGMLTQEDVLRFCRSRLADHKVPRSIRLVSQIPRTDRGKIDRGALVQGL